MPTDHVPGKPRIGTYVDYYNPRLMQRIGFTEGYGKRYDGPYAALVTNHLPEVAPMEIRDVPHKDKAPAYATLDGTNHPGQSGNGYWDWQTNVQAARAAKELKDSEHD